MGRLKGKKSRSMFWGELDRYTQIRGVGEVLGFAYLLPQTTWLAQWNCNASQDTELASLFAASCTLSIEVNASLCYFGIVPKNIAFYCTRHSSCWIYTASRIG
jgi:hypothetical protein